MEKVLVLLGCGYDEQAAKQNTWTLNQDGKNTVAEAIKQLQKNHFDGIFVSGGQSVWYRDEKPENRPTITEAKLLVQELIAQSVSKELLYTDFGKPPEDTIGNAISTLQFVREHNVQEITVLHRASVEERTRGIYSTIIPESICQVNFITIPNLYPLNPEQIHANHILWLKQEPRLKEMLPKICHGEITTKNLYDDGRYREETSLITREVAMGRMLVATRK